MTVSPAPAGTGKTEVKARHIQYTEGVPGKKVHFSMEMINR